MRRFLHAAALLVLVMPAWAVQPDEILPDPALETRARALSKTLRCMVCQNESIDDSNAPLAKDLRILVRERIQAGDSDAQVRDFLVARYGEFVLLSPRFRGQTLLLWGIPALVLLGGGAVLVFFLPRRRKTTPDALTADEQKRLKALLKSRKS